MVSMPQVMAPPSNKTGMTAEEFALLNGDEPMELINGEVIVLSRPGFEHGEIVSALIEHLRPFIRRNDLGRVVTESGFRLSRNPDMVRGPDVAFVEKARLPEGTRPTGFIEGAPTLAVEVNSPNDLWSEVEAKARLYLSAGSRSVWIVDAETKTITIRRADGTSRVFGENDTLRDDEILPGFEIALGEIFD